MSDLKTLKEIIAEQSGGTRTYPMIKDGKIPKKACKKQTDGYYNDAELKIEGVTYTACAFGDDETQAIIKFINQFFNLEGETDDDGIADVED